MPRSAQPFNQTSVTRVLKAAVRAGFKRAEFRGDGSIVLDLNAPPIAMSGTVDELDRELAEFEARHGEG
ncbi:hypothetical protein [Bradyrhizobium sp. AUGA SZCCT0182]|uniref:hypothetical protein n=1 Tax=Bradyrhizobium sp. AUGA SZCCT0182 TaxID=2807667 RepID=UPI001BA67B9B|nr:hypothetical protein [Bradyrhizobium sp. AUGA SZCCT0182]MBR1238276.1 hypothetical protein [Bradyrhizobium sp. AUGA SZCCT0182]